MPNVLVPCGGRWVGLVLQLKQAMRETPALQAGRLFVADRDERNPAGLFADGSFRIPEVSHPAYLDTLLDLCRRHDIRVVLPHLDIDLDHLCRASPRFADIGTTVVCPRSELVQMCRDKRRFAEFAREEKLPHPRIIPPQELRAELFPLFAKRPSSSASLGAGVCRSLPEALAALQCDPDLVFQELIEGAEVSVDAYLSARGRCTVRVPRLRVRIIGGEAVQSCTIRDVPVTELADRTIDALARRGYQGPLNLQLFGGTRPVLIEVNARLGSASVLSNQATGGRLFAAVLSEACGSVSDGDPDDYRANMHMIRYWGEIFHEGADDLRFSPPRAGDG
jgi:carbamoyl-phosphate synthase large subunit